MPRPSLFTSEVAAKLLTSARRGATRAIAASSVGITTRTLNAWLISTKPEYSDFAKEYLRIESEYDLDLIERISDTSDYRALDKVLSRRNPENKDTDDTATIIRILSDMKPHLSKECFNEFLETFENLYVTGTN
jgi:hypothetical protein